MEIIRTTAPIGIADLKKFFVTKDLKYVIDYANSTVRGEKLLTYLSNLDVNADIEITPGTPEADELLLAYLTTPFHVQIESLDKMAINKLLLHRFRNEDPLKDAFVLANMDVFDEIELVLGSLALYAMWTIKNDVTRAYVQSREVCDMEPSKHVNLVNLLKYTDFYDYLGIKNEEKVRFLPKWFTGPVASGKELYHYWDNANNPLQVLIVAGLSDNEDFELVPPTPSTESEEK